MDDDELLTLESVDKRVKALERGFWYGMFATVAMSGLSVFVSTKYKPAGSCSCGPKTEQNTRRRAR